MISVYEFIKSTVHDDETYREMVEKWSIMMKKSGYHSVMVNRQLRLVSKADMIQWCYDKFGKEHFAWSGVTFWFEREEDAMLFALRWV